METFYFQTDDLELLQTTVTAKLKEAKKKGYEMMNDKTYLGFAGDGTWTIVVPWRAKSVQTAPIFSYSLNHVDYALKNLFDNTGFGKVVLGPEGFVYFGCYTPKTS